MKSVIVFVVFLPFLLQCTTSQTIRPRPASDLDYGQFFDLAHALRQEPGLLVSGFGRNVSIRTRRSVEADLLYVVNGMEVGNDYNAVNDQLNMSQVQSIRVGLNLTHRTVTGKSNAGGIVEIITR